MPLPAEITHNIFGPHDAKFYKLLDELTKVRAKPVCCWDWGNTSCTVRPRSTHCAPCRPAQPARHGTRATAVAAAFWGMHSLLLWSHGIKNAKG